MSLLKDKLVASSVVCFGIALRSIVSIYPHSGESTPPMFGDYEAQRHWQEITINLKPSQWYINSTENDLQYWGLDYPPLTAYHSYGIAKVAQIVDPRFIALNASRGFESDQHKFFMRLTVLFADMFIYIPSLVVGVMSIKHLRSVKTYTFTELAHLIICLIYPGQILIDNGHFQYNNISLGLAAFAIVCIIHDRHILSAILFSLALNYKQMELYHALPFFVYLLRICCNPSLKSKFSINFVKLTKIAVAVLLVFTILWLPWLSSTESAMAVVRRIFPIGRGVFEDKVANIWCVVNIVFKLKYIFTNEQMAIICLAMTIAGVLPTLIHLFKNPTKQNFLYSLFNCSISFFLFSFQVHEKTILLPVLPALFLFPFDPFVTLWFLQVSVFSMFPLLEKDKLTVGFFILNFLFQILIHILTEKEPLKRDIFLRRFKLFYYFSIVINITLVLCHLFAPVPKNLPHIYSLAISSCCCCHFVIFFLYFNLRQFISSNMKKRV